MIASRRETWATRRMTPIANGTIAATTTATAIAAVLDDALKKLTAALRPWTIDFHVAQNDATVKGSGSHDTTGRHCLANDPNC